ncbi:TPD1 protein [Carex littledalei]|uniref:TPD1 protein n=1 Tax=Carex littledalei TaxID=544730 RepID=A0A833RBN8_9POAL|nr:TPD1 protein [Carex littledalei]
MFWKKCSASHVLIHQYPSGCAAGHIPKYTVHIFNMNYAPVKDVHIACGFFASTTPIYRHVFNRISTNDCLVKGGKSLSSHEYIVFDYSNEPKFALSFSKVKC